MKKLLTVSLLILGIILISGCSLTKERSVDNSTINEQITTPQKNDIVETDNESKKEFLLYYHNSNKDYDWVSCDPEFVLPIKRNIAVSKTPIKDVFTLLFEAKLTNNDLENGFNANPMNTYDFTMKSIVLNNGILKIDFYKNQYLESLSSCESSIFMSSLKKTALQFPEIKKIQLYNGITIEVRNN